MVLELEFSSFKENVINFSHSKHDTVFFFINVSMIAQLSKGFQLYQINKLDRNSCLICILQLRGRKVDPPEKCIKSCFLERYVIQFIT